LILKNGKKVMSRELSTDYDKIIESVIQQSGYKNKKMLVHQLSKWLEVSETSVYNKLRDRSKFSVDELALICKKLKISLDHIIFNTESQNAYVHFFADGLRYQPRHFSDYIQVIINYFSKIKQLQDVTGYFLANEVPLFHFLSFPNLLYLKLFIWNKINWKIPQVSQKYDFNAFKRDQDLQQSVKYLRDLFNSFHNVEIWNPSILDNTIAQFKYLKDVKIISDKEDIYQFSREMERFIDYLEELTITGYKPQNAKDKQMSAHIFITDLTLGSEIILVKSEQMDMLFQQIDVPNYMHTSDEKMIRNQFAFFENIRKMSTHITHAGEKERLIFFDSLRQRLEWLKH
jgi:hypothetical protein